MEIDILKSVRSTFKDRRVLLTGHTGFKGSWFSMLLHNLGAKADGFALDPPTSPSLFDLACCSDFINDFRGDITDFGQVKKQIAQSKPEIVFHFAAQSLVRLSYDCPHDTFMTNVVGTLNVLEAVKQCPHVKAIVVITSDKVYENKNWIYSYRECDRIGGHDPYSGSKASAEIMTSVYQRSFFGTEASPTCASCRAGNVIGGGDYSKDRLIPDIFRAFAAGEKIKIRNPDHVRPWQHVLEPLFGYLLLGSKLLSSEGEKYSGAWNFGPSQKSFLRVSEVADECSRILGGTVWCHEPTKDDYVETEILHLCSEKALFGLKWRSQWNIDETLARTVNWYRLLMKGEPARDLCLRDINDYFQILCKKGISP